MPGIIILATCVHMSGSMYAEEKKGLVGVGLVKRETSLRCSIKHEP